MTTVDDWLDQAEKHAELARKWDYTTVGLNEAVSNEFPRALAALRSVLELHKGSEWYDDTPSRRICDPCGEWAPCQTTQAITKALEGEAS